MLRAPAVSWVVAAGLVGGVAALSVVLVARAETGPEPPFLAGDRRPSPPDRPRRPDRIELAGSGSNLPLTRRLVAVYRTIHPEVQLVVHESIGSTGGMRALRDGAVDVALVSRPLRPEERSGARVLPYARVAVVVAAHRDVPDRAMSEAELLACYRGERTEWSDGRPLVVFQRERGDSSHVAVERVLPAFARVNDAAWRSGRFRVFYSDPDMQAALVTTPGAVGLTDLGAIAEGLPLIVLELDGMAPTEENVASGRYPFRKDLAFVLTGDRSPAFAAFLDFVYSEAGQAIIRSASYVPLPRREP